MEAGRGSLSKGYLVSTTQHRSVESSIAQSFPGVGQSFRCLHPTGVQTNQVSCPCLHMYYPYDLMSSFEWSFTQQCVLLHRAHIQWVPYWAECSVTKRLIIFAQEIPYFHFALGPANYRAGSAWDHIFFTFLSLGTVLKA